MDNNWRVSVVIPAYKAADTICRAVDSVLSQTYPAYEIIIVDDGSPDNQVEVIERTYGDKVILVRQPNGKTAKARNRGIERATGDVVAFLDADDYWECDKIAKQVEILRKYPEVALVAGLWFSESPGAPRVPPGVQRQNAPLFDRVVRGRGAEAVRCGTMVWTGTVMIRREVLDTERFVSGLEPAEDRDLWIRIAACHPIFLVSQPLATAVLEPGSISRTSIETDCRSMIRVIERNRDLLGAWRVRIWRSYTLYRWSAMDPCFSSSVPRLVHSFLLWPLPYRPFLQASPLGRTRRFLTLCREVLRH